MRKIVYTLAACLMLQAASLCRPGSASAGDRQRYGTVLGLYVFGDYKLDKDIILKAFGMKPGDPYSNEGVRAGLANVEKIKGIHSASIKKLINPREEGVRLAITVTEEKTWSYFPWAGRNLADKIAVGAGLRESYLMGKDQQIFLLAAFRGVTTLRAEWRKPSRPNSHGAGYEFSAAYRAYDYPFPDYRAAMKDRGIERFQSSFSFAWTVNSALSLKFSPGLDLIDMEELPASTGLPGDGNGGFMTIETGLYYASVDDDFYPTSGIKFSVRRKDWGVLQQSAEMKNSLHELRCILHSTIGRAICSIDSRGSFVHGEVPLILLRHLGGIGSIRGYDFGILSGDNSLLFITDLRLPLNFRDISELGNPVVLVDLRFFVDSGTVWSNGDSVVTSDFHSGFGFGLDFIPAQSIMLTAGCAWHAESSGKIFFDMRTSF